MVKVIAFITTDAVDLRRRPGHAVAVRVDVSYYCGPGLLQSFAAEAEDPDEVAYCRAWRGGWRRRGGLAFRHFFALSRSHALNSHAVDSCGESDPQAGGFGCPSGGNQRFRRLSLAALVTNVCRLLSVAVKGSWRRRSSCLRRQNIILA